MISVDKFESARKAVNARCSANMMEPFPDKPKGMHWQTYDRLWWEHHEAEMEQLAGMSAWLDKMEKELR